MNEEATATIPSHEYAAPKTFKERALPLIERGITIFPVAPHDKNAILKDFPNAAPLANRKERERWYAEYPDANVGCLAVLGFCYLDDDTGTLRETIERETGNQFPRTFTVRTGVKKTGLRGHHYYFKSTEKSILLGNANKADTFDFQAHGKYVVGAGSVHPDGSIYTPIDDSPIAEIPDWLVEWITQRQDEETPRAKGEHPVVREDFDVDAFIEHYELEGTWEEDKFFFMCPFKGDWHTNGHGRRDAKCTALLFDGTELGFSCFATSCSGCGAGIGALIKKLNEEHEPYLEAIWEQPTAEQLAAEFGAEDANSAESPPANGSTHLSEAEREKFYPESKVKAKSTVLFEGPTSDGEKLQLHMLSAADVEMEKKEWLVPGMIPRNKITLFSGRGETGKTSVALDIAARVTTGRDFPNGEKNEHGAMRVLIAATEDDLEDTIVPNLAAMKADLSMIGFIHVTSTVSGDTKTRKLQLQTDLTLITKALKKHPEYALVILDPLISFIGKGNKNDDDFMRPILEGLKKTCAETRTAFVGIIHYNKKLDLDSVQGIAGAGALGNVPRVIWGFCQDPEDKDQTYMSRSKGNILKRTAAGLKFKMEEVAVPLKDGGTADAVKVNWLGKHDLNMDEVQKKVRDAKFGKKEVSKLQQACAWLKERLKDGAGVPSNTIFSEAEAAGHAKKTMYDAKAELGVKAKKSSEGWSWSLPAQYVPDAQIPNQDVL